MNYLQNGCVCIVACTCYSSKVHMICSKSQMTSRDQTTKQNICKQDKLLCLDPTFGCLTTKKYKLFYLHVHINVTQTPVLIMVEFIAPGCYGTTAR